MQKKEKEGKKFMTLKIIIIILLIIVFFLFWARFIATRGLKVKEYAINAPKMPSEFNGLKIVHFSDLHYGSTVYLKELKSLVKKINDENPDIIVFTGDLVEDDVVLSEEDVNDIIAVLKELKPKVETLAVIGNHDYNHAYFGEITEQLDWHVLDNTYEFFYYKSSTPLVFVGLDDLTEGTPDYENAFSYINETDEDLYTIVLCHEPDQVQEFANYDFDLVLAGHSHLGQVRIPLIGALYTPPGSKIYYDDYYLIDDASMYVSGGIGTSTIKMRFLNKPSINLYRFYTK